MIHNFEAKLGIPFILIFLLNNLLFSQSNASKARSTYGSRITGFIIDETTQTPISNVNIYFEQTLIGTTSEQNGYFSIDNVPDGNNVLMVKHIAYKEKQILVNISQGQTKHFTVLLIPKVMNLREIIFTASGHAESVFKSHMSVTIATNEKIAMRTFPNTADALREIPGILVQKTTAGHGSPIIRGLIGKDVLLLYNGIRLNKPTFRFGANQYMNTINVESLDRIEVTKGPGSVMYGSDAIGGVINMISESYQSSKKGQASNFSVSSRYGTADRSKIINATFVNRIGGIAFVSGLGLKKIGDLKAGKDIGKQIPTAYDEWNTNLKLEVPLNSQTSVEFDLLTVQQDKVPRYDKYGTAEYETYLYDPQNRYLAALTVRYRPSKIGWVNSFKWNFSYQLEEEGTVERKMNSSTLIKNRNDLTTLGSNLQINSIWQNQHVLSYGYEIYWDKVSSSRTRANNGVIQSQRGDFPDGSIFRSLGIFLNDNLVFSTKIDMTFGFRWSQVGLSSNLEEPFGKFEDYYNDVTGTCGFSYKPNLWLNLIARYAKGFRAPNFNDTIVLKVSNTGVDAPSPGLSPEKSHNFEIGVKLNQTKFSGSLFLYYNRLMDLIDRYRGTYNGLDFYDENGNGIRDVTEVDIFQKRNVDKGYIAGCEIDGRFQITSTWSLQGFAFYTYGQNIMLREPMSRIPPLMAMVAVQYMITNEIWLETIMRAAAKQDRLSSRDKDDTRIPPGGTSGWRTLNFRCLWQIFSGLKLNIILENIFDETYKEHGSGVYSGGRSLVVDVKFNIN